MRLYKYLFIACVALFSFGMAGCSDENEKEKEIVSPLPGLKIKEGSVRVKIGADNKVDVDILEGGDDYHVFSTDEDVVTAEIIGKKISLEGKSVGEAVVILSDKNSKYLKFPVSVYLTDKMKFSQEEVGMEILMGHRKSATIKVTEGNGGYKVESDNPNIKASVTEEGEITVDATAAKEAFTGSVTVKDKGGVSASFTVKVSVTTNPFPDDLLAAIKSGNKTCYFFDGEELMSKNQGDAFRELKNGKYLYGWKWYERYKFQLSFKPDLQAGKKTEAAIEISTRDLRLAETAVDLEIIQNDGKKVWGIFSFPKNGIIHYGYFCDDVVNEADVALTLEKESVEISGGVGEPQTVEVKILSGSGEYEAGSDDEAVEVSISDGVLSITGTPQEEELDVTVTVTDVKTGKEQTLFVKLVPEGNTDVALKLDKEEVVIMGEAGKPRTVKVKILSGSGEYEAGSKDENVAKASIADDILSITATPEEGEPKETEITVTDTETGNEVTVQVFVVVLGDEDADED